MRQRRDIVEQRAHPQRLAAFPAQRQIDRAAGGVRRGRIGAVAGRRPIAFDFRQSSAAPSSVEPRRFNSAGIQTSWK